MLETVTQAVINGLLICGMSFGPSTRRIRKCWISTPAANSTGMVTTNETRGSMPNWVAR